MRKIVYILLTMLFFGMTSCDNFLDTTSYTQKSSENFPKTTGDINQLLTGTYAVLDKEVYGESEEGLTNFIIDNIACDDMYGAGGENDKKVQAIDFFMTYGRDMFEECWGDRYKGIDRANNVLENIDNVEGWSSDEVKNQVQGEAYFLRALFYFDLTSLFGEVPLILSTDSTANLPKATPEKEYAQIASDLKNAIELMSKQPYNQFVSAGHATRWAAEGMMARVFLFYTGFYAKTDMPLADGGSVTKDDVIAWLKDCIDNSGHSLVPDYRDLWSYTNKYTVGDYSYTKGQGLAWVENDGAVNPETIFAIKFSNFASYDAGDKGYSNLMVLRMGCRGGQSYANTFPFGQGWGWVTVNPKMWNDWKAAEPNDIRREASIIDIPKELPNYKKGGWNDYVQETDFLGKKYMPVTAKKSDGSYTIYNSLMYGGTDDYQIGLNQDIVLLRLADVYLMYAELTEDATYMNKVRERAGLPDKPYTLENLQNERRWELAFEGVRWNDIRRWHIAEQVLGTQNNQPCYFKATPTKTKEFDGGWVARYQETKGFYPIPESQINLSDGVLTQNDGWGTGTSDYAGWE